MRLRAAVAGVAIAAAGLGGGGATAAFAHGERNPAIRTVVEAVSVGGVQVRSAPGVAARLELTNRSGRPVEVLAASGEPFLRVGPAGVEANVASPTWYASGNPDGIYKPGRGIGPREPVRWRAVTSGRRWAWFAHELHPADGSGEPTPAIEEAGRPARLAGWRIGLRSGAETGEIAGRLEYRPSRGSFAVRLTTPVMAAPGVRIAALNARSPGLFLQAAGRRSVEVDGPDGRPWARVEGRRTLVDVASPIYREQPGAPAGPPAPAGTPRPRWRRLPTAGTLNWVEPRARYRADEPPAEVLKRTRPSVVQRWSVGLRVGGRDVPVRGETSWVPIVRGGAAGAVTTERARSIRTETIGFGLVVLLAAAGGLWVLRRRALRRG